MRNRLVVVALAAWISSCGGGNGATPLTVVAVPAFESTTTPYPARIAGTSPSDIWAEYDAIPPTIWHYDGAHWGNMPLPPGNAGASQLMSPAIASAGPGAVWAFFPGLNLSSPPIIQRITADGHAENHSAEIVGTGVGADYGYSLVGVHVNPQGGVYVEMSQAPNPGVTAPVINRLYRAVAGHFERLVELPVHNTVTAVLSDTEIWIAISDGPFPRAAQRYQGGQWVPFDPPQNFTTLAPYVIDGTTQGASVGSASDVWFAGADLGLSGTQGGMSATPGSIVHFDGTSFSTQMLLSPTYVDRSEGMGRWGVVSVAPGVVALLRNHVTANNLDVESERWDGTRFSEPRVLVHSACTHSGCQSREMFIPVLARLGDGTIVHGRTRAEFDSSGHTVTTRELLLGHASDY